MILDLIFPIQCLGCKKYGEWLCDDCLNNIYDSSYQNQLLKKAIHTFKYKFVKDLARPLAKLLLKKIDFDYDFIVPVPLHSRRLRWRGFNQAELLAKEIDKNKVLSALIKIKNTKPQVQFSEKQREQNITNAFKCVCDLTNKKVLLIDDVETTGSTLRECEKALLQAGAKQVYCLTLAKT
ncbi:MAG: ComF family protein [bacterium]